MRRINIQGQTLMPFGGGDLILLAVVVLMLIAACTKARGETISRENLRLTVVHMQALAREQGAQLAEAQQANLGLIGKLTAEGREIDGARAALETVKAQADALQRDRDAQAARAVSLAKERDAIKSNRDAIAKRLDWLCLALAGAVGLLAFSLVSRFASLIPLPYSLIAPYAVAIAAGGAVFAFLRWIL